MVQRGDRTWYTRGKDGRHARVIRFEWDQKDED
jgi:hypothetical protein